MAMPEGCCPLVVDESSMGEKFDDVRIRLTNRPRLLLRAAVPDAGMIGFCQLTVDAIILLCAKIHTDSPFFYPAAPSLSIAKTARSPKCKKKFSSSA